MAETSSLKSLARRILERDGSRLSPCQSSNEPIQPGAEHRSICVIPDLGEPRVDQPHLPRRGGYKS